MCEIFKLLSTNDCCNGIVCVKVERTYGYVLTSTKDVSSYIQEHGRLEETEICSSF
jgi:hypothetical protein